MVRSSSTSGYGVTVLLALAMATSVVAGGAGMTATAAAQDGAQGACDYESLYDETIDAVVQIRLDEGLGSGFVIETRGGDGNDSYVVTNEHVVGDADSVTVAFSRGETRDGDVVGTDRFSDLAVVSVDAPGYVDPLTLADREPDPGQAVAALGSPFGLAGTVTQGIVSGVNRSMPTGAGFDVPDTVQTDAAINPGNSGGPLVGCEGSVVGVNRAGGGENVGFAVSAALVQRVVPALITEGEYRYAYLGVRTGPVTPALAAANDLNTTQGVYVDDVVDGGPAADALQGSTDTTVVNGTRVPVGGDVVVAVDGQQVRGSEDLASYLVTEASPGDDAEVTVLRDGQRRSVNVTLGTRPGEPMT